MGASNADRFTAIVVAAGQAARFGGAIPKQFMALGGLTVVEQAIAQLLTSTRVRDVVVVLPAADAAGEWGVRLAKRPGVSRVVAGGATRAASVLLGLTAVEAGCEFVLVHDAARPLVSTALIDRVVAATLDTGAALPVLPIADTVKRVDADNGRVEQTLDRTLLRLAQTPQGSRREALIAALEAAERRELQVTDEAAALELAGHAVATVAGDPRNLKITTPADLQRLTQRSEGEAMSLRVGTGFDIHRVDSTRPLVLGGIAFPDEPGLEGHSDADVVMHAAMDAVLGAAGAGDIGTHFPPGDDRWAGADSADLARRVAALIGDEGFQVVNIDLMLLAERPKIGPHVERMRAALAAAFEIDTDRIGLKATTMERLGAIGRHEGIACQAVALLQRATA